MTTPETVPDAQVDAEVRRLYGAVADFLTVPELGKILRQAAKEGWDNARVFGALQQTNFWRTTPDPARRWTIVSTLDPATAKRQTDQAAQTVRDLARQEGLTLPEEQIRLLALDSVKNNWNSNEILTRMYRQPQLSQPGAMADPVATQFGYLAVFLGDPELGPLLKQATIEGWSDQRLAAALQKTDFWRRTTDAQRRFTAMQQQNPAEAEALVSSRRAEIRALSASLGVELPDDRLNAIATDSVRFGWNGQQTRDAVTADFDYQGGEGGQAGQSARQVREMAAQYLVPISDQTLDMWVEQMVRGTADEEAFRAYLVEQAKSLFPGMSPALDRGITVAQYADPYKQLVARELEVAPETIDLMDPRYRKMLDQRDSKGNRVAMTLSESSEYLRSLPEWQQTRGANERAASLTENILRTFGKVAV
jgi:hypothetical protein